MSANIDHDLLLDEPVLAHERALPQNTQQPNQFPRLLHSLSARLGQTPLKELVAEAVGAVERHCIQAALASTDGNRSAAAKMLGLSRQSLYMKLARYDIGSD